MPKAGFATADMELNPHDHGCEAVDPPERSIETSYRYLDEFLAKPGKSLDRAPGYWHGEDGEEAEWAAQGKGSCR